MSTDDSDVRSAIVAAEGHLLVLGGPGAGKTTIALRAAKRRCERLQPGQEVLFLSFSRSAVRQVLARQGSILTSSESQGVQVKTYHAFCLDLLRSFGKLLTSTTPSILYPSDETLRKSRHTRTVSRSPRPLNG